MGETPTEIINLSTEFELNVDSLAFFKAQTKIQDDDEVKSHIAAVKVSRVSDRDLTTQDSIV